MTKPCYKRKGIFILQIAVYMALFVVFSGAIYLGGEAVNAQRYTALKREVDVVDRALEAYAASHIGIDEDSIHYDANNKLKYNHTRLYPKNLKDIQDLGILPRQIDLEPYKYSVSSDRTKYKLEANFDKETYVSPRSNMQ